MRVYGRVTDEFGNKTWVVVTTDPSTGLNDYIYLTALIQELKLNLGESPFWANRGIPAEPSVLTQVAPDYYTFLMQSRYAPYFMSIIITKVPAQANPTYRISIVTHQGVPIEIQVPV